jgi:hypothetical protein
VASTLWGGPEWRSRCLLGSRCWTAGVHDRLFVTSLLQSTTCQGQPFPAEALGEYLRVFGRLETERHDGCAPSIEEVRQRRYG